MTAPQSISKTNASFPKYLSFQSLRKLGIAHCQSLSSDLWTDFNLHDPGLTILETLCYALTDLGYRTNFPIEDLVARSPQQKNCGEPASTPAAAACGKPFDDNFFTPEQILTCNPVTMLDLRKLLIDIPGVKNAWLERADAAEVKLYLNEKTTALQYDVPEDLVGDGAGTAKATVTPDGLYVVCLELDGDEEADACAVESIPVDRILNDVWTLLHSHRNLCEDFIDVIILGDEDIALCADIEIDAAANPEDVLLAIYQKLETFLSPMLTFYSLQEMLARGKRIEEIYAGRPLTPLAALADEKGKAVCSHGFIDIDELIATERRTQLHTSDLYQVIMDVPGVLAVRKLLAVNYVNGFPQTRGEKWCLNLTPKHRQRFDLERSQIEFFKGLLPFSADKDIVAQRYKEERDARTKAPLEAYQLDQPVPEGTYRDLQDYRSIIHEFPLVYGIGEGGVPESATEERKAQARQLRAYLLFYDQILANFLAQLAHLRELFSICPDKERTGNRTYFTQLLSDIPQVKDLLQNYNECEIEEEYPPIPENYPDYLDFLVEGEETYYQRRNRFLDHLLARFAESFTDYVLLMFDINGSRSDKDRIIRDKTGFLSSYPETSRNRGKGFDYTDPVVWDTNNVSGLEKRVSRLLGLGNPDCQETPELRGRVGKPFLRRTLSHTRVVEVDGAWHWKVELPGIGAGGHVTLTSRHGSCSKSDARVALAEFRVRARDERNIRRLAYANFRHFGFGVLAPEENSKERILFAEYLELYPPHSEATPGSSRDEALEKIRTYVAEHTSTSGDPVSTEPPEIMTTYDKGLHYFTVTVFPEDLPPSKFTGSAGYLSADLAREAAETLLTQAAQESEYHLFTRDGFDHHGFAVVGPDEVVLAEVDRPWPDPDTRDLYLYRLIQLAIGGSVRCELQQETECHFYQLLDAHGETLLFESVRGYPAEAEADASFELEFLPRARDEGNYRDLDAESEFGFELLTGPGEEILATHPHHYATAEERALRKLAILYYLNQPEIHSNVDGEPGRFGFELRDISGEVLLESAVIYLTENQANAGYRELLELAHHRASYCPIDDHDNDRPYGFELVGSDGELLARHPKMYETAMARDLAIDVLIRLFCPVEDVRHEVQEQDDAYAIALLAEDGMELLVGTNTYESKEDALYALRVLLDMARQPEQYVLIDDDGAYGFVLNDAANDVLAIHPATYAHAVERDLALRGIVSYVCPASVTYSIDGEPGQYHYFLLDPRDSELFRSIETYHQDSSTRDALEEFLDLAADERRYCRIDKEGVFGFELLGDEGAVAEHGERYATVEEREAAIAMIIAYLSRIKPQHCTDNPTGAFRFELRDESGEVALSGIKVLSSVENAKVTYKEARALARDKQRYRRTDDGPCGCPFGYEIVDENGAVVAEDPRRYASANERDETMKRVYALVHDGSTIPDVVWPEYGYGFELTDHAGNVMLESIETYETSEEAEEASESIRSLAVGANNYDPIDEAEAFSFQLSDGERWLARHPSLYATQRERDAAIYATRFTARSGGAPIDIVQKDKCRFAFQYLDADAAVALLGTETAADEGGALELLLASYERAIESEAYVCENGEYGFGFLLVASDGKTIAEHPTRYVSAEERNAALQDWLELLLSFALEPQVVEVPVCFFYHLVGFEEDVLLRSTEHWQSAEEAEKAFRTVFAPLAQSESSYKRSYDNEKCTYSFELRKPPADPTPCATSEGALLAKHGRTYRLPRLRDEHLQSAVDLVRSQVRDADFPGVTCGHFFRLVSEGNELVSTAYYPDAARAASACTGLLTRLAIPDAYLIEQLSEESYRLVVTCADDVVRAASAPGDYDALAAMRDALLDSAAEEVGLPHALEETRSEFRSRLTDAAGETLLERAHGHSAEIWAHVAGFECRGPRDAAIRRTKEFFAATAEPPVRIDEMNGHYYFVFDVSEELELCSRWGYAAEEEARGASKDFLRLPGVAENYRTRDVAAREFAFEIFDKEKADENREKACEDCNVFVDRAQDPDGFRLMTASETCAHGFELVGADLQMLARYPRFLESAKKRDECIGTIQCLVDAEGFHLVEHLPLRPKEPGTGPAYGFALSDAQSGKTLVQSLAIQTDRETAVAILVELLNGIIAGRDIVKTIEVDQSFGFYVEGEPGEPVASPEALFCSEEERDEARDFFLHYVATEFQDPASRKKDALEQFVFDIRTQSGRQRDALIPLGRGCRDADGNLCPVRSDPYSFRVTVVVPYWPRRFRHSDFRPFFERTLRLETPAHIFPRICWVDVCQMQEFEDAYRRWLRAMAHPTGDCDRTAAQNALVHILFNLKSVYSTARLFGCTDDRATNPLRLDQTILGTTGTDYGDSS